MGGPPGRDSNPGHTVYRQGFFELRCIVEFLEVRIQKHKLFNSEEVIVESGSGGGNV